MAARTCSLCPAKNCAKGRSKEALQINRDLDNIKAQITFAQFLLPTGRKNCNPHCHLIYNRVSNEGKTITDQNDFRRNEQVTKLLKQKYGLTSSKGKYKTKTERLRGTEKTKYEIHHLVMSAASESI